MSVLARVGAHRGHFGLLAVLVLLAALLITAGPRIANRLADAGLRQQIGAELPEVRDLTYEVAPPQGVALAAWIAGADGVPAPAGPHPARVGVNAATEHRLALLDQRAGALPPQLRDVLGERWYQADAAPAAIDAPDLLPGPPLELVMRATTGGPEAVDLVSGRWPRDGGPAGEVVLADHVAAELGLRTGSRLSARPATGDRAGGQPPPAAVFVVVGLFRAVDPAGGVWDTLPHALRIIPPPGDGDPNTAVALTTPRTLVEREEQRWAVTHRWRYRVDPQALDARQAGPAVDAINRVLQRPAAGETIRTGIDRPLREFLAEQRSARAVLAVVTTGVLAALAGLTALAALLAARRRAHEYALLRARGGAVPALAGRSLAEALLVVPLAALLGWVVGMAVPARPAGTAWIVAAAAVLAALAPPLAAVARPPATGGRAGLLRMPRSAGRMTLDVSVVVLAVLGAVLLRRRGLPADGSVDPLLVAVPVLLAAAGALVAVRLYPWLLRLSSRLAARARGGVAFLGLARAGRAASAGPLVVVVIAVAVAAFSAVGYGAIERGRDRAAQLAVPGDLTVTGERFAPDTVDALADLPGVRAVTPVLRLEARPLPMAGANVVDLDGVLVIVVDDGTLAQVTGVDPGLPAAGTAGPVPALVSSRFAAGTGDVGAVSVQGQRIEYRVDRRADTFPTVASDATRFMVLPWAAVQDRVSQPLAPNALLLAGAPDEARVARVADEGQRRHYATGLIQADAPPLPPVVQRRAEVRDALGAGGANGLLAFGFAAGAVGGTLLGLLAIAFAVAAGSRDRAVALDRLRTMGLSRAQRRDLVLVELAPLVMVAVLTGAAVGVLVPVLVIPALELSAFTGGLPVVVGFEPALLAGAVALGALALLVAVGVEATAGRRRQPGEAVRLG